MPHTTSATHAQRLLFASMLGLMWAGCGDDFVPDQPPPDPCAMISCNTPAEPSCQGQIAVTYSASGTCQGGACAYQETLTNCAANGQVCSNGVCLDMSDPCATISCNTPPERSCQGQIAVAYSASGTCQGGACAYQESLTNCAATGQICSSGLCVDMSDPCAGISCNEPPAPSCDGQVAVTHNAAGTCQAGQCAYQALRADCAVSGQVCSNGVCIAMNDPCAGISCNTPPAASCDGQVAVTHNAAGACQAGLCSYQETRTDCAAMNRTCSGGVCMAMSDPCANISCNAPPAASCTGQVAINYNAVGSCQAGLCSYQASQTDCASINQRCDAGVCRPYQVTQLTAGGNHTCALRQDNTVVCWGLNSDGQLGDGTTAARLTPIQVSGLTDVVEVAAEWRHTCVRRQNNSVACWGWNLYGQLGDGTTIDRLVPMLVSSISNAVALATGGEHNCVRRQDNTVACWGRNMSGQLGDGTTINSGVPAPVSGLSNVVEIDTGFAHSCAKRQDNTLVCWGRNDRGQLGDGTTINRSVPGPLSGLFNVIEFAAGDRHTCARLQNNTVACWGRNDRGQLGDGTLNDRSVPAPISGLNNVVALAAGRDHTCARLQNNTVVCWGRNDNGQLGDGTFNDRLIPTPVSGLLNARALATGSEHACAQRQDNTIVCWGLNLNGQLGDGTTTNRNTPTQVLGL